MSEHQQDVIYGVQLQLYQAARQGRDSSGLFCHGKAMMLSKEQFSFEASCTVLFNLRGLEHQKESWPDTYGYIYATF
jgi:hypothetical protein